MNAERAVDAAWDRSSPPPPGPVRPFVFPTVQRRALANGVTLLTARSGDLPLVTAHVVVDAGGAAERAGEKGVAWLTSQALDTGTASRTADELAWEVEMLGAELESWVTWDGLHATLTTRADRLGEALDLLADVIRNSAFPAREIERLREEQAAEILRRGTEPRALADDAAVQCIFAPGTTYHTPLIGAADGVRALTREQVQAFHGRTFTPGNTAVVVVGAVDADAAEREVQRAFGDWQGAAAPPPPAEVKARAQVPTVYLVDRPSAVQSELRIGHVGVARDHEDYFPILVMNALLGGAFTSRLNLCLREKHGFTYGVRSGFGFRREAGPFIIQTAVASDVTARAVAETLREIRELQSEGATEDEVRSARDYLAGTLPLQMQSTGQLADRVADLHTYQLPADYFESHRARLAAVTGDEVQRAAREHVRLGEVAVVVVGNADAVEEDLRELGIGDIVRVNGNGS